MDWLRDPGTCNRIHISRRDNHITHTISALTSWSMPGTIWRGYRGSRTPIAGGGVGPWPVAHIAQVCSTIDFRNAGQLAGVKCLQLICSCKRVAKIWGRLHISMCNMAFSCVFSPSSTHGHHVWLWWMQHNWSGFWAGKNHLVSSLFLLLKLQLIVLSRPLARKQLKPWNALTPSEQQAKLDQARSRRLEEHKAKSSIRAPQCVNYLVWLALLILRILFNLLQGLNRSKSPLSS